MNWNFWESEEDQLAQIVQEFPDRFAQLQLRWAKFKLGLEHGLFTQDERRKILDTYAQFPETWETIKPNWVHSETGMVSPHQLDFAKQVDTWVSKLKGELGEQRRNAGVGALGLIPIVVGAIWVGVALLGVGAVTAAVISALAWFKDAENDGRLIDGVTEGRFSENVLIERYRQESSGGLFSGVGDLLKWGVAAGLAAMFWPQIRKVFQG